MGRTLDIILSVAGVNPAIDKWRDLGYLPAQSSNDSLALRSANASRGKVDLLTLDEILAPVRSEDEGTDLWNTFNVVQEKMIHGGFHTQLGIDTKVRKVRAIKSFEQDINLNKALFEEAKVLMEYS